MNISSREIILMQNQNIYQGGLVMTIILRWEFLAIIRKTRNGSIKGD